MPEIKVLIADDDRDLTRAIAIYLKSAGFKVISSVDAYQALALAGQNQPDIAVLDINMPAGGGVSVQQRLRQRGGMDTLPVIYLTGDKSEEARKSAIDGGAYDVLYKPVDMKKLVSSIRSALNLKAA